MISGGLNLCLFLKLAKCSKVFDKWVKNTLLRSSALTTLVRCWQARVNIPWNAGVNLEVVHAEHRAQKYAYYCIFHLSTQVIDKSPPIRSIGFDGRAKEY
jgi:hypothetical protein